MLREKVLETLPADRLELLRDFVRERVVNVLKLDSSEPPSRHDRLMDLGFDLLMAVQLRNQLARGLALERPLARPCCSIPYPTIEVLAAHLLERAVPPEAAQQRQSPLLYPMALRPAAPEVLGTEAVGRNERGGNRSVAAGAIGPIMSDAQNGSAGSAAVAEHN